MICPKCGSENSPYAKFCDSCGSLIPEIPAENLQKALRHPEAQQSAPQQSGPQQPAPQQSAPQQAVPSQSQPQQPAAPVQSTPQQDVSFQNIPTQNIPSQPVPSQNIPQQGAPMTFASVHESQSEFNAGEAVGNTEQQQSRYAEYNMSDVAAAAAPKKNKKFIMIIIIAVSVIILGVAAFFVVRMIMSASAFNNIKENPTKYLSGSYLSTSKAVCAQNSATQVFGKLDNAVTYKVTTEMGDYKVDYLTSVDKKNKKVYYSSSTSGMGTSGLGADAIKIQFYADMDKAVMNYDNGSQKADGYISLSNLRADADASIFSPKGENPFKVPQEQYDNFLDTYEFVYNGIKADSDFGLKTLGTNICKDFDECGNAEVTEESVTIDGTQTDAYVIRHTIKDTKILNAIYRDIKNWAQENIKINEKTNKQIMDAIAKIDPINYTQYTESAKYEIGFAHYINKSSNLIMKAEYTVLVDEQKYTLTMTFGADPANSRKISIDVNASGVTESILLTNESTDAEEKFVVNVSGAALNGSITYVRNRSTGDFTITNNTKSYNFGGEKILPEDEAQNNVIKGNITTTEDSVMITYTQELSGGITTNLGTMKMTVEYSSKPQITELKSDNNILKMSKEELQEKFGAVFGSSLMTPTYTSPEVPIDYAA